MNILFLGIIFISYGCAHKNLKKTEYDKGYSAGIKTATGDCETYKKIAQENEETYKQNLSMLEKDLAYKNEMLSRFNLIGKDGKLKSTERQPEKQVTGKEKWQK